MTTIQAYVRPGRHAKPTRTRRAAAWLGKQAGQLAERVDHPIVRARITTVIAAYTAGMVAAIFGGVL